jgi:pyrroline-5-carboxylate reductase
MTDAPSLTLGVLGLGAMGGAIARAASSQPWCTRLVGFSPSGPRQPVDRLELLHGPREVAAAADILVLAVKPQRMREVCEGLRDATSPGAVFLSVAAGLPLERFARWLAVEPGRVVRAMPNLAAGIGASMTGLTGGSDEARRLARLVLEACGEVLDLPHEDHMHAFTALAGSAPALVAVFADALCDAGVAEGLPRADAVRIVQAMLRGTGSLMVASGQTPVALRDAVCSPGGTSIAGVIALESGGVRGACADAVKAIVRRSRELSG